MRFALFFLAMLACEPEPAPEPTCDVDNTEYETAGCPCEADEECTCQVFDGSQFYDEAQQSSCNSEGACIACLYM